MEPLIRAAVLAALLSPSAFAVNEAAAPEIRTSPQAIGAMAENVTAFFSPRNANPDPASLSGVVNFLQTVGRQNGPTRAEAQPVLDRIALAADEFSPIEPSEQEPPVGLASSVKLELLAGPLKAWLAEGQKDSILRKQAEYGAKLTRQDRERLSAKMKAMAEALKSDRNGEVLASGEAAPSVDARGLSAGAEKVDLWHDHGHLTEHIAQVGRAPDVVHRPGRFEALQPVKDDPSRGAASSKGVGAVFLASLLGLSIVRARRRSAPPLLEGIMKGLFLWTTFMGLAMILGLTALRAIVGGTDVLGFALGTLGGYSGVLALSFLERGKPHPDDRVSFIESPIVIFGLPVIGSLLAWFSGLGIYAHPALSLLTALVTAPLTLAGAYLASMILVLIGSSFDRGA